METYRNFDRLSFDLGMIEAFCEMVEIGVKPLALSPIIPIESLEETKELSAQIEKKFGVKSYVEYDFPRTDLATPNDVKDAAVIFYYNEETVIEKYRTIKQCAEETPENPRVSMDFRLLLGYPRRNVLIKYLPMLEVKDLTAFIAETDEVVEIEQALYLINRKMKRFMTAHVTFPKVPNANPYYVNNTQLAKAAALAQKLDEFTLPLENGEEISNMLVPIMDKIGEKDMCEAIQFLTSATITQIAFQGGARAPIDEDSISLFELAFCTNDERDALKSRITETAATYGATVTFESGE